MHQPLPASRVRQLQPAEYAAYQPAATSYVSAAPVHVVQGASTRAPLVAASPSFPPAVHQARSPAAVQISSYVPVPVQHGPDQRWASPAHLQVAAQVVGHQAGYHTTLAPVYAPVPEPEAVWEDVEDLQEQLQLGDEACNVQGYWQEPVPPDQQETSEGQFLALLESLEARVDLMSQMQQTRAAIQQRTQEVVSAPEEMLRLPEQQCLPKANSADVHLWERVKDQESHIAVLNAQVESMRRTLTSMDTSGSVHADRVAAALGNNRSTGPSFEAARGGASDFGPLDVTQMVDPLPAVASSKLRPYLEVPREFECVPVVLPFCTSACGLNLELSEDGYTATRTRGCRQSVAIGNGPLPAQEWGRYFEITVDDTVAGWVGGLGIGVTASSPVGLKRLPDKAWRVPRTWTVGYWGCVFLEGTEHRTEWRSDTLQPGARVGLLVTDGALGDLIVFVDGEAVVKVEGAVQGSSNGKDPEPLYPVVDVFAATRVVTMSSSASPPPGPWATVHSPISAAAVKKESLVGQAALHTVDVGR
eukprot:gb/GFBE01001936.1/.p1 GENE.gb/GFBE01001936.1/~~gb/GFBE01001936.1/.p1  ORF type:complete len:531 (+),score=89.84 gb/GFBE01001936.1/:1-1593(+)